MSTQSLLPAVLPALILLGRFEEAGASAAPVSAAAALPASTAAPSIALGDRGGVGIAVGTGGASTRSVSVPRIKYDESQIYTRYDIRSTRVEQYKPLRAARLSVASRGTTTGSPYGGFRATAAHPGVPRLSGVFGRAVRRCRCQPAAVRRQVWSQHARARLLRARAWAQRRVVRGGGSNGLDGFPAWRR